MKLSDLIEDLQELATIHGKDVDVEFDILILNDSVERLEYHHDDNITTLLGINS